MARYRAIARKVIEASQFVDEAEPPIGVRLDVASGCHVVKTMQGVDVPVLVGEWIVKEASGPGYYPIDDAEFRRTYEPAKDLDSMTEIVMQAITPTIGQLVQDCADGKINFDELCRRIAAMGYKTTSLYEMVRAAEAARLAKD